jgi:hypothetical protein
MTDWVAGRRQNGGAGIPGARGRLQQTGIVADEVVTRRTEEWFVGRGLPHFIADYDAATDIWTRALPALTLLFLFELVGLAPNREFPFWLDVVVVAAIFLIALGGWAFVNRLRNRPALARPDDIGPIEVAAFVIVPPLVPLAAGGQVGQAVATAIANVALLGIIYLSTSYGLIAMTRWGLGRLLRQIESVTSLVARALPLLALLVTFLFLTQEVWQTAGDLAGAPYWLVVLLFPLVGTVFLVSRLPRDVGELNRFDDPDEIEPLCVGTPVASTVEAHAPAAFLPPPPLDRREWGNVGLVALFSQGVQIVIVSVLIGGFFVLLGMLLVNEETTEQWAGQVHVLATLSLGEQQLVLTEQLLRVAGFLTAFSGLNFTVYVVTDVTYRREFRQEVVNELRQAFAVRAVYRADIDRATLPPT